MTHCLEVGVVPVGIETYANSRRLEKSFRLQGADLETEYNACESAIERRLVKEADFHGKAAHLSSSRRRAQRNSMHHDTR